MEVREDDEDFQNPVDLMFEALERKKPNHFAVRQYKKFKLAAGKTAKSILISCGARLAPFDIEELREITAYDELELDTLGDKKTALFLIMSDTDVTFNFLISMIYTQLFNLLCEKADDVYGGRLPVHVRCLIDECANIGQIPNLEKLVATIRSREISACLVLQAQSQLKAIYKDNPGLTDPQLRQLVTAHIDDDSFCRYVIQQDINKIAFDLRETHKDDFFSVPEDNPLEDFLQTAEETAKEGSDPEQVALAFICKRLKLNLKKLSEEEKKWLKKIAQKSDLLKNPNPQRGRK